MAVFVPDELFERAEDMASRLSFNRSQFYARAVEEFLNAHGEDPVTRKLNELADELDTGSVRPSSSPPTGSIDHASPR